MELLLDPQAWLSFFLLAVLEVVLGIDNIIFLSVVVDALPSAQRASARVLGLTFAMVTRIALLGAIVWLTRLRSPLFAAFGRPVTGRDLILFGGGVFLVVKSALEIRETLQGGHEAVKKAATGALWLIILEIGLVDIVFSLDSVFSAIGLAKHIEVMVAAIVVSMPVMMVLASGVGQFIEQHPSVKILALVFLVAVGASLIGESLHLEIPQGYLYFAMFFAAAVEAINMRLRARG